MVEKPVDTSKMGTEQMVYIWETWAEGETSARALVAAANANIPAGPFRQALKRAHDRLIAGRDIAEVPPHLEAPVMAAAALFTAGQIPDKDTQSMVNIARAAHVAAEIARDSHQT